APQLDLFSGDPYIVTFRNRIFLEFDTELVLFDSPFAGSLATHGSTHDRSISLIEVAPVHVIRQFHAGELGANLPSIQSLKFPFCCDIRSADRHREKCKSGADLFTHRLILRSHQKPSSAICHWQAFEGW